MSNYLAIATVTAVLQRLLQEGIREDVPGAVVTTVRPDSAGASNQTTGVNIYLYLATPNPAWRNADLRTRRPKGELIKHGQAGLDLYYLLTFYGDEQELEPQRLLGSAVRTLVDQPIVTQEMIQDTIDRSNFDFLAESTLAEQVQSVMLIPSNMTSEEMSRIWSIFFQTPYSLSFAFQGTAVLIQGDKSGKVALPVRRREFYLSPSRPAIDRVEPDRMITLDSILSIQGRQLLRYEKRQDSKELVTRVKIGQTVLIPLETEVSDDRIKLPLSLLEETEIRALRAGVQGIQVLQVSSDRNGSIAESNVMPFVLCAAVTSRITISNLEEREEGIYWGEMRVRVNLRVGTDQRVFLLLNGLDDEPQSYVFRAAKRSNLTQTLRFPIQGVISGSYLVRIQIDGAESPLEFNEESQQFISPIVQVGRGG